MKRIASVIAALVALSACETGPSGPPIASPGYPPPPPPASLFRDQDFAWSTQPGTGSIDGVLAYRGDGGAYTCNDVILAPETPWSRARMHALYLSATAADVPVDQVRARTNEDEQAREYQRYARRTRCDAAGRFVFEGLPDGGWFVITVATPAAGGARMAIMRRLTTGGGPVRVVLR